MQANRTAHSGAFRRFIETSDSRTITVSRLAEGKPATLTVANRKGRVEFRAILDHDQAQDLVAALREV